MRARTHGNEIPGHQHELQPDQPVHERAKVVHGDGGPVVTAGLINSSKEHPKTISGNISPCWQAYKEAIFGIRS